MSLHHKSLEEVRAEGDRRRAQQVAMEECYRRDLRRWNRIAAGVGAVVGAVAGILVLVAWPLVLCYALVGGAAGWLISRRGDTTTMGVLIYAGAVIALSLVLMTLGLQPVLLWLPLIWMWGVLWGGIIGLAVGVRETRMLRSLREVESVVQAPDAADPDVDPGMR
ncbi:MAG: hypothetical protein ACOCXJ_03705 [Planctomycetota bacterium]